MRYEPEAAHRFDSGAASRFELQGFGELGCESALRFMIALPAATTPFRPGTTSCGPGSPTRATRSSRSTSLRGPHCTFSRLSGVGTKYLVLQRSAIKAANNRRHLVRRGGFHKCEALGLLRLVIANHLDRIRDEIVCGQPLFNVVGSYPDREVAQKYGKAHSVWCLTPLDFLRGRGKRGRKNRISCLPDTNRRQCVVQWHGLQVLAGKAFGGGFTDACSAWQMCHRQRCHRQRCHRQRWREPRSRCATPTPGLAFQDPRAAVFKSLPLT